MTLKELSECSKQCPNGCPNPITFNFVSEVCINCEKYNPILTVIFINYKGIRKERDVIPNNMIFSSNKWHTKKQWLLDVYDIKKKAYRTIAMDKIISFKNKE